MGLAVILKQHEGVHRDIEKLEILMRDTRADSRYRQQIDTEIRKLRAGDRGEAGVAYHLKSFFGDSKNWIVLNDLRIEHDGLVAQIDHILIGRMLDIWVCESKSCSGGVKINDRREFTTFFNGRPRGMASPIEQNERHVRLLRTVFDAGLVTMPKRLGFLLKPRFRSLILIANGAITRPKVPFPGLETVIKGEHLKDHVTGSDEGGNPLDIAKIVSPTTLEDIGRQLLALHKPIVFDWHARLEAAARAGKESTTQQPPHAPAAAVPSATEAPAEVAAAPTVVPLAAAKAPRPPAANCKQCGGPVSSGVKSYCVKNAERFAGAILCQPCQAALPG
ncbi:nuclease-related domain-containing protein [Sandarakinorhabdus sp. DWP1-3-1]|uniref:nuclease-related domain-containing protein n=1 Tax=Sandarakinorhabdus sp. DWP1-3-1 TaxID=2804627 RepID=UPI003CECEDD3